MFDQDRIIHPLRLARGSHQPGSGKGCAMNVISYINGDTTITDFPDCSAEPLAKLVQMLNDRLAGPDGFLSPEDSVLVLDLGWLTVGTADTPAQIVWRWLSELLIDPEHGVVQYASDTDGVEIRRVAELCLRGAAGEKVSAHEWLSARYAAVASSSAVSAAAHISSAASAYTSSSSASYAASYAAYAAAYAAASAYASYAAYTVKAEAAFTRWAIQRWRDFAGLDNQRPDHDAINIALSRISTGSEENE